MPPEGLVDASTWARVASALDTAFWSEVTSCCAARDWLRAVVHAVGSGGEVVVVVLPVPAHVDWAWAKAVADLAASASAVCWAATTACCAWARLVPLVALVRSRLRSPGRGRDRTCGRCAG